ncbi:MAG TPA: hypothetical protein VN253_15735, partial [Kofleriaceae bacterium]|nr:hypothetical protein [Kofleriaceae bacterium]
MLAVHVRSPWKLALAALLGRGAPPPEPVLAGSGQLAYVHAKLRADHAGVTALRGMSGRAAPLFTHLAPAAAAADDDRARWIRVRADSRDDALRLAEQL